MKQIENENTSKYWMNEYERRKKKSKEKLVERKEVKERK